MRHANDNALIRADGEITVELLERCLDRLAAVMHKAGDNAEACLPLVERIEREIAEKQTSESTMSRMRRRVRR